MIAWEDGIEHVGSVPLREIVQRSVWSSSIWISPDGGDVYRRYYNAVTKERTWEEVPFSLDRDGERMGIHIPNAGWMSIETAIATAWLHRAPRSRAHARLVDPSMPDVRGIVWNEPEWNPEGRGDFEGERWKPLRWRCGQVECDTTYDISNLGRLRSGDRVTRGFAALGTRWAAVRGAGLVDLPAAAGLVQRETPLPPRVYNAYVSLSSHLRPEEHAKREGITVRAAWQYYCLALPLFEGGEVGRQIVSPDVWEVLTTEMGGDPLLCGKLSDLRPAVSRRVGRVVDFDELRFARCCVASQIL